MSDELRRQVDLLAEEYLRLGQAQLRAKRHRIEWDEVSYALDHLRQADEVLNFLRRSGRDPYATLRNVDEVLGDAESGLKGVQHVLDETGAEELLNDHLDTLMRALSAEALPGWEADVLDAWGFPDLARTIGARADLLGDEWRNGTASGVPVAGEFKRDPVTRAMEAAGENIGKHRSSSSGRSRCVFNAVLVQAPNSLCGHGAHRTAANTSESAPARPSVFGGFRPCSLTFAEPTANRGARIRTGDLTLPKGARYQAAPRPDAPTRSVSQMVITIRPDSIGRTRHADSPLEMAVSRRGSLVDGFLPVVSRPGWVLTPQEAVVYEVEDRSRFRLGSRRTKLRHTFASILVAIGKVLSRGR
jgi:hypothetical protein